MSRPGVKKPKFGSKNRYTKYIYLKIQSKIDPDNVLVKFTFNMYITIMVCVYNVYIEPQPHQVYSDT